MRHNFSLCVSLFWYMLCFWIVFQSKDLDQHFKRIFFGRCCRCALSECVEGFSVHHPESFLSSAKGDPYLPPPVPQIGREPGARRSLVYLPAKYQGNRRLSALPPTLAA